MSAAAVDRNAEALEVARTLGDLMEQTRAATREGAQLRAGIVADLHRDGMSVPEIARHLGVSRIRIYQILDQADRLDTEPSTEGAQ